MANDIQPSNSGLNIGRLMVFVLILSLGAIVLYKYYGNKVTGFTSIPKEMQLNYIPADFKANIDPEDALAILQNPYRYRREFNQLVYDLNVSVLNHVGTRMGLNDSLMSQIQIEYDKHHPYLRNLYFHDFVALKDTTSNLYQTWYDNEASNSVEILNEIASKYTCFLVNQIMTTLIETKNGNIYAKGQKVDTPCGIALTEALKPMVQRMEDRAAIDDFSRSKGLLQEKVEKVIAELATMEVQDKKGLSKKLKTKVLGFNVSSTDLEVTAISIMKIGFKLNDYFDVQLNSKRGLVTITLPEPKILSHEVYPKLDKMDIGWLREVQSTDLNKAFNVLRAEFRRDAIDSDIMEKAKKQAIELMNTMFVPLISNMNSRYQLRVKFQQPTLELDNEKEEDQLAS